MKQEVIHLMSREGTIATYNSRKEAYDMLGYNFIQGNVGVEFKVINPTLRDFANSHANKKLSNSFMADGVTRRCDVMREINSYSGLSYYGNFVLLNEFNERLCIVDFYDIIQEERKVRDEFGFNYYRYSRKFWNGEGAVPGTGKRVHGRYYRRPKTLAALKEACSFEKFSDGDYVDVPVRGKRRKGHVPTAWDDQPRFDKYIKNWKRFRKNQYKEEPQK